MFILQAQLTKWKKDRGAFPHAALRYVRNKYPSDKASILLFSCQQEIAHIELLLMVG